MPRHSPDPLRTYARYVAGAAVIVTAAMAPLHAQPVTYTFAGLGTGSFDGVSFTNAAFRIALRGDISSTGLFELPIINATWYLGDRGELAATVDVDGLLTGGTFSNPLSVVANRAHPSGVANTVGVALGDRTQDLALLALTGPAFGGVTLRSPDGPISATGADIFLNPAAFAASPVSGRVLVFTSVSAPTFTVSGGGVVTTIPEPSAGVLTAGGFAMLAFALRRRSRPVA
jgi:hypothetical protein